MSQRDAQQDGVSLVEMVITIAVATIISVPVGMLLMEHLNGAVRARDQEIAMHLARYELERLDALNNYATLASVPAYSLPGYAAYTITTTVSCQTGGSTCNNGGAESLKRIQVDVRKTGETNPLASLVTYRAEDVLFGS